MLLVMAGACPAGAQEGLRDVILGLSENKRVKIVWSEDTSGDANHFRGGADVFKLKGYDTQDDAIREILPGVDDYTRPIITSDGERIVYTDRVENKIFVVNWNGTNRRLVVGGPDQRKAGATWYEPPPGDKEWVYYEEGGSSGDPDIFDRIERINLDDLGEVELVWDQTRVSHGFLAVSSDGRRVAGSFPWPDSGAIEPLYDGSGDGPIYHPPTGYYIADDGSRTGGCWPTITPDERYIFGVFNRYPMAHRHWNVWSWPPGERRELDLHGVPGNEEGWEMLQPRMSNHPQFLVIDGPYDQGPMGENNIAAGGPQIEIFLGKVDAGFTQVTDWVQITHNNRADFYPHAWVASSAPPPVHIDSFTATPAVIASGGSSTLQWATRNADSVFIDQGIGGVSASGSRVVSPTTNTTYTLTAEGPGEPLTARATVTVVSVSLPLSINCGDGSPSAAGWQDEDLFRTSGAPFDFTGSVDLNGQPDPAPADVYLTCVHTDHEYTFPIPDGTYTVRLHFYDGAGGSGRAMDYSIEGIKVLDDFNIVEAAGGGGRALVREFTAVVSDGDGLQISAEKDGGDDAFEAGIEILEGGVADTQDPELTILAPMEGASLSGVAEVSGTASDNQAVALVEVSLDGEEWDPAEGTTSWSHSLYTPTLEDGPHTIAVRATDPAGNQGFAQVHIETNNTPRIAITSPTGGETWPAGSTQYIQWTTENLADVTIRYSVDGGASYRNLAPSVASHQPEWGNYPWVVPNECTDWAMILIHGYFDSTVREESETFTIEPEEAEPGPLELTRFTFRGVVPRTETGLDSVQIGGKSYPVSADGTFEAVVEVPAGVSGVTFAIEGTDGKASYRRMVRLAVEDAE
jgi:hypothetical protein